MRQSYNQRQLQAKELIKRQLRLCSNPNFQRLQMELMNYFTRQKLDSIHLKNILTQEFQPYTRFPIKHQHLCTKELLMDPKDNKKKGYTCLKCRTQVNSIICQECFDQKKHQDHPNQVKFVKYEPHVFSTCDCGDAAKWNQDGFCNRHQFVPQEDCLSEEEKKSFKGILIYLFKVFNALYLLHEETMYRDGEMQKQVNNKFNVFGNCLMEKLVQCNKDRMYINKLTSQVIMESISLETKQKSLKSKIQVLEFLFSLTQQQSKDIVAKCVKLFILLVYRNQPFRQILTIRYIKKYSEIVLTKYQDLSCYLLANSLMIAELAKAGRLGKFTVNSRMASHEKENISKKVQVIIQAHKIYNTDIFFLTNLTEPCAVAFWKYFNDIDGFLEMANYSESFTNKEQLDIVNQEHYRFQYWFLARLTKILDFISNINDEKFMPKLIYRLFEKITQQYKQKEKKKITNNLFFTYQRFWALCVYLFISRDGKKTFMPNTKESKLQYNEQLIKLYKILNLPNIQQAKQRFSFLLQKIINYVEITTPLSTKSIDEIKAQNKTDFVVYYYGNDSFLFNIDAIFYQIVVKMMVYLQDKASRQQRDKKTVKEHQLNQAKTKLKQTQTKHPYLDIERVLNDRLDILSFAILSNISEEKHNIELASQLTKDFLSFTDQIIQMHYSQVPDLYLAAKFPRIRSRQHYRQKYMQYYHNLLASISNNFIHRQAFIQIVNRLLFEEHQVLRQFIYSTIKKQQKLFKQSSKGKLIDLRSHMPSIKRRTRHNIIQQNYNVIQVKALPFLYQTRNHSYQLMSTRAFYQLGAVLDLCIRKTLAISYQQEEDIYLTQRQQEQKIIKTTEWKIMCFQIVRQMWKISKYCQSQQFPRFFTNIRHIQLKAVDQQNNQQKATLPFLDKSMQQQLQNYLHQQKLAQKQDFYESQGKNQYDHQTPSEYDEQVKMNIQSDLVRRKKEESFMSSSQLSSKVIKSHICAAQKCPFTIDQEDIHQLCYAVNASVPNIFGLIPTMNAIYFTSCQHYFHKICLHKLIPNPKEKQHKCPKCQSRFNFLLVSQNYLNSSEIQDKQQSILEMFDAVRKALSLENIDIPSQVIKSSLIYILMASTISKFSVEKKNSELINYLLRILQRYLQNIQKAYDRNQKDTLKFVEGEKTYGLLNYLKQVIASTIGYRIFDYQRLKQAYISSEQAQIMERIILRIFNQLQQKPTFSDKIYLKGLNKLTQQRESFKCFNLPKDLFQLSQLKGKCCCEKTAQRYSMVCLQHRKNDGADFSCLSCQNIFIKSHIQHHKGQSLVINIDTGLITYYLLTKGNKYWTLPLGYVYKDSILRVFSEQLGHQYFQNIQNKKFFELIPTQYERILFEFHSKVYFASGQLKEIKFHEE